MRFYLLIVLCLSSVSLGLDNAKENGAAPEIVESVVVDQVWAGHPVSFSLYSHKNKQYVAYYNQERQMVVASRQMGERLWQKNVLPSEIGWDSHNYITMDFDRDDYLHVSGNMHVDPLVYFRSDKPEDIENLQILNHMTGEKEKQVTYPKFFNDNEGRLLYMYRHGSSGDGLRLINRYDEASKSWSRLLDAPLLNGRDHSMNAYNSGITRGPDGWFHMVWMWRDTPDCQTNHDISYMKSKDMIQWQTAAGEPIELPVTPDNQSVIVDPVPPRAGLINMGFGMGFDPDGNVIVHYHKYDEKGNSQIYLARWQDGEWKIHQPSDWDHRWEFGGGGSVPCLVRGQAVRVLSDGRFVQSWSHETEGSGTWLLDPETLMPVKTISLPPTRPPELNRVQSDFEGMQVQWRADQGTHNQSGIRYYLRWETMPANRDRPHEGRLPPSSELRLYGFKYTN